MKVVYRGPKTLHGQHSLDGKEYAEFPLGQAVEVSSKFGSELIARGDFDVDEGKGKKIEAGSEPKK